MSHREDERLEDYIECLQYNLQRSKPGDLDKYIYNKIMIWGMKDDCFCMLNLMGKWDISNEPYNDIITLYLRSSRGPSRTKFSRRSFC